MSALRKSQEVGGLSLVRAVRHARTGDQDPVPAPKKEAASPPVKKPAAKPGSARIGHTALPTKNEIHCYECSYVFQATGRAQTLRCPKCRAVLDQSDYTISTEHEEPIRTTGRITVAAAGVLKSGALVARDIAIAGSVVGGTVKAHRRLEILAGAEFDQDLLSTQDLQIAAGASCRFRGKRLFRDIEVRGELNGHIAATGVITVKPGGHLKGRIHGAHLIVEEGGGLTAALEIEASEAK